MELLEQINSILWGPVMLFLLLGTGVYFTVRLRFIQVRKFGAVLKQVFGGIFTKKENIEGGISSFQALTTAVAAQVGTGNVAGVATAIAAGGPGAVFWMWVSAFFGMATNFSEAVLAQKYKEKRGKEIVGGPAYYIEKGTGQRWLAVFFSLSIIIALGIIGNMVQSNSIANAVNKAFNIPTIWSGIFVAIITAAIIFGGIGRIAKVTEGLVPFMAVLYITGSLIIIISNYPQIIPAFRMIIISAFNPKAALGGAVGIGIQQAFRYGISRGLFSNEAGMGSTPHAHALATVDHPAQQGLVAIFAVFVDTIIVCSMTALVIMTTGAWSTSATGAALAQDAFTRGFGTYGNPFVAICLFFFAYSTVIGWSFFGESNVRYLFGKSALPVYRVAVLIAVVFGTTLEVPAVWALADTFNALMVAPNVIAILILSGSVVKLLREYENDFEPKHKK